MKGLALIALAACGRLPLPADDSGELRALATAPGARIVWIGAHPDDETLLAGALFSLACRDGAACEWILVTDGRTGACSAASMSDGDCPCPVFDRLCPAPMAAARLHELTDAAAAFGASVRMLAVNLLPQDQQQGVVQGAFNAIIAEHPSVIITHAPTGGYGIPAHRWVGQMILDMWRALPRGEQPIFAQALDLTPASVDQPPVTDTISGDEHPDGVRLWTRVREALRCFVTQVAGETALVQARASERSSFRLLHPGE
jgi:LmbE family N-acetylglucosaminyl deacetylase